MRAKILLKIKSQNLHIFYNNKQYFKITLSKYHQWVPVTTAWHVLWVADGGVVLQIWRLAVNSWSGTL